jgi:hypothetical protein
LPTANGSEGCESTGATITSSTIIPSANPPLKHMPIAPTPGPPSSRCNDRASARSQPMIGDVWFSAQCVNSLEMHTFAIDWARYGPLTSLPGVPTSEGITTVNPAATTSFANLATFGVMPGISCTTITAGPLPRR